MQTFVGKVMSLLFNMLFKFAIVSHPSPPPKEQAFFFFYFFFFNFVAAVNVCSDFGAQENKICHCCHFFPSICHEVMILDTMILVL